MASRIIYQVRPSAPNAPRAALHEPIAIVGMACRFPGADNPEAFWDLLVNGREHITEVGADRWNIDAFFDPDPDAPGKTVARRGGFLPRVDLFDAEFFGISPREACAMDSATAPAAWRFPGRLSSERASLRNVSPDLARACSAESHSAITPRPTGIPATPRVSTHSRERAASSASRWEESHTPLGLRGPNIAIDTACSSSLVAVHTACQSLRNGECDLALAGGINLMLAPEPGIFLSKSHALAPDGHCKAFDASADGYVRGEGCGMVVLRRLSDAIAAKDNILAVVRSSAINHDGRSNGLTAPNGAAQQEVIREAVARARHRSHRCLVCGNARHRHATRRPH